MFAPRTLGRGLLAAVVLCLWTTGAAASAEEVVRLTLDGPGTPFERVEYEARVRGASVVIRLTQSFGEGYTPREAVGLSTPADLDALVADLVRLGLEAVPAPPTAAPGVVARTRQTLTVERGAHRRTLAMTNPELLADRRYLELVRRVRTFVVGIVGEPPFVDGRIAKDEAGFLHLEARPNGRVFLNDLLLAESTPIEALRLPLGAHVLRIVAADGRTERKLDITIEKGKTTSLRVNLE